MAAKRPNPKELVGLLRRMWLIRAFEEKLSALYAERQVVGLLHLGIGQEAVAVGALSLLRADDYVYGGDRSHGHAIAQGAGADKINAGVVFPAPPYYGGQKGSTDHFCHEGGVFYPHAAG